MNLTPTPPLVFSAILRARIERTRREAAENSSR